MDRAARLKELASFLYNLSDAQLTWLEAVIRQFQLKPDVWRNPDSDLVTACVLERFGDALQIHHCFSSEPLTKGSFEYALERVLNDCGIPAKLSNPESRHDITIKGVPFSLKTEAAKNIRKDFLHISKFMELGKGRWVEESDLVALRDSFLKHMESYDRILQLRRITNSNTLQEYELVEIPKFLLSEASNGAIRMAVKTTQNPKPGYCTVTRGGKRLFELYFDAGSERKLQLRYLDKAECVVHANWKIKLIPPTIETL
jgi:Type II site-specific deoxyribonuclease